MIVHIFVKVNRKEVVFHYYWNTRWQSIVIRQHTEPEAFPVFVWFTWGEKVNMNFHIDIYKSIANDRMEHLKKEARQNRCFYNKKKTIKRKKNLLLSLISQLRKGI